jgi:energy-coupling factor transport system ATP-binding protein
MSTIIRLSDVWFQYPQNEQDVSHWALCQIDLTIEKGEYVAIIGPNGSGKSTLARMFNGLLVPTKGTVQIADYFTHDKNALWEIRRMVGMVFQNPDNQIVSTTVRDDIAFGLENLGIPRTEMIRRIEKAIEVVGLTGLEEEAPHYLSGGQKQRLCIAGILVMQPKVILFDEATSMLDPQGRKDVLKLIDQLHRQGKTVIHITHAAEEAFLAKRIIVMNQGKIELDLPRDQLYQQADCLQKWGLEVPLSVQLHRRLRDSGVPLTDSIHSEEELVSQLCKLLSKS